MSENKKMACDAIEQFNDEVAGCVARLIQNWPRDPGLAAMLGACLKDTGKFTGKMCDRQEKLVSEEAR